MNAPGEHVPKEVIRKLMNGNWVTLGRLFDFKPRFKKLPVSGDWIIDVSSVPWTKISLSLAQPKPPKRPPEEAREYSRLRKDFLSRHKFCAVAAARKLPPVRATHVHHVRGRKGANYLDVSTWLAVSFNGDRWIHANEDEARKLGLLA